MKKIFIREIEYCSDCPSRTADMNVTRWECRKTGTFIGWMGEGEDTLPIPSNCPLDESPKFEEEEFVL